MKDPGLTTLEALLLKRVELRKHLETAPADVTTALEKLLTADETPPGGHKGG